jgi:hypothetical protein
MKLAETPQTQTGTIHWFKQCANAGRVHSEVVNVTPGLAAFILDRNADNRGIKSTKIKQYVADMKAGHWTLNGEPIIVSQTGELNDGQHRLSALIDAGIVLPFLFVFGVTRESRTTVDQGAARGANDYLAMNGTPNSKAAASLTRLLIGYEEAAGNTMGNAGAVTSAQIMERVENDPLIAKAASYAQAISSYAKGILSPALIGFTFYVLSKVDADEAREFMDQVCIGENIKRGDPAFAVRHALSNASETARAQKAEMLFRAWNAYRLGQSRVMAKSMGRLPELV